MSSAQRSRRSRNKNVTPAKPLKLWQDDHKQEEVRIEIIPLIDVIFCILTFFILAAVGVSRQQAISLNLPKATTGSAQMQEMLIVSLDDFGQVYIEQSPVMTRQQLYQAVENYFISRPNGVMVLYASKDARYDEVIQVLDILREAGGDRVSLATLPKGQTPPQPEPGFDPTQPNTIPGNTIPLPSDIPGEPTQLPELEPLPEQGTPQNPLGDLGTPPIPSGPASGNLDVEIDPPETNPSPNLPPLPSN